MIAYLWPIALVVVSNIVYQICAKSVPSGIHPLASLTATYLVGALVSGVLYYLLSGDPNLLREYGKLNWASVVLGLVIVGLEAGWLYAYKAGWQVSTGYIVQSVNGSVFKNNKNITSVTLADSIESIGGEVFSGLSMKHNRT